jgi:hypothetical protein
MAASGTFYNSWKRDIGRAVDLSSPPTVKMSLHTSTYAPQLTHAVYADLGNELSTANGYTNGGLTLSSVTWSLAGGVATFAAANAVWTASGGSIPAFRYAVLRLSGTFNALVDPLILYYLCDTTPADVPATSTGQTLTLAFNSGGIFIQNG